jgi:hypothetical protein
MYSLEEYIKADRQWPRRTRIARAVAMHKQSTSLDEKEFWNKVLEANGAFDA